MEQNPPKPMTPFDNLTTPHWLYMMKLMLPYTPPSLQQKLAVFIRFQEMQYTLKHFHGFSNQKNQTFSLNDLKPYMDTSEQEMMDQVESIMSMMEMMQGLDGNNIADLFNMKGDFFNE